MIKLLIEIVGTAECADIKAEILLDNKCLAKYTCSLVPCIVEITVPDQPAVHDLHITMLGKTHQHTVVGNNGEIESDASIVISRLEFEDIDMMPVFCQGLRCYYHNHNNSLRPVELDEFYGYIGCNGDVHIEFETPIYLWFNKHFCD
jgi:hypothetical protein